MGSVIVLHASEEGYDHSHERVTCTKLAPRLAALKGFDFKQRCGSFGGSQEQLYFVPRQTLIGDVARELGITGENDLFGGVVSHAVVATKAITHPLVSPKLMHRKIGVGTSRNAWARQCWRDMPRLP